MKKLERENANALRFICGVVLSVWTGLVGVLFIIVTWHIYRFGGQTPYTTERIQAAWKTVAAPFWIWIAMIVFCGVLSAAFPLSEKRRAQKDTSVTLKRLLERLPAATQEMGKQRRLRAAAWAVSLLVSVVCIAVTLVYLLSNGFQSQVKTGYLATHEEAERLVRALPWVLAAFGVTVFAAYFDEARKNAELSLVKKELAQGAKSGAVAALEKDKAENRQNAKAMLAARILVAAVAVALLIVGIAGGGVVALLDKAVNICTQCIGLG